MSAKIVDIVTEVPAYRYRQEEISAYMQHLFAAAPNIARQINVLYKKSAIDFRHSILPDFQPNAIVTLFKGKPLLSERLDIYKKAALALATSVAQKCIANHLKAEELTHIITVSCTGLHAPGLEIQLIKTLNLSPTIGRHPINFVGCYASIPALNLAKMICSNDSNAKVLIVSVELCTLHFNEEPTRDNLMANALFADGAAACLVVGENVDLKPIATIGSHFSQINSTGENEMAWTPSEHGFLMKLTSYVPNIIENDIAAFVQQAASKASISVQNLTWAFHPGGAQILTKIAKSLQLDLKELSVSFDILKQYGNMSSATILFVIKALLDQKKTNKPLFACAFGPGLTFESIILEHV